MILSSHKITKKKKLSIYKVYSVNQLPFHTSLSLEIHESFRLQWIRFKFCEFEKHSQIKTNNTLSWYLSNRAIRTHENMGQCL